MTSVINDNDLSNLEELKKKINSIDEELIECSICFETTVNKYTACSTCNNCICINCYNKTKQFNIRRIPVENEERGILYTNKCPFCTNITTKYLSSFEKDEIISLSTFDYNENFTKLTDFKKTNTDLEEENFKLKNLLECDKGNVSNVIIDNLKRENSKLKKELEDKNNIYKIDIFKYDNNRLINENTALKKENNELKTKNKFLINQYNVLASYFNTVDVLFGTVLDNIKKVCNTGKSMKIDKQIILNEANKKFNININIIT